MLETRRRVLDRFGPSGGGNTLCPVCGCIVLMLGCALGSLEVFGVLRYGCSWNLCSGGAPAALIYPGSRVTLKVSWSATGRSPSRLQLCLLYTRKVGLYPYTDRSFT